MSTSTPTTSEAVDEAAEAKPPLQIDTQIESPSACIRQVVVTVPQAEVRRYFKDAYDEIVPEAQLPGFRSGRAPRALVEKQFKDRVSQDVKNSLLMDSLSQITESDSFSAIGEPDFDYNVIKVPDEGDFKFQFSIEVRPDFDTPNWKGIAFDKPVEKISDEDIDVALARVLRRYATWEATEEPAELGDRVLVTAKFFDGGKQIASMDEERVMVAEKLTFSDAVCESFGEAMVGATEDDVKKLQVKLIDEHSNEEMAGKEVDAEFTVVEVLKAENPALTPEFLEELGDFESEDELRGFVRESLERQADYRTNQAIRKSVTELLTDNADFELPPKLVRRQANRELERKVIELRRSGFDEDHIRSAVNLSRQNAVAATEAALREHFILEQIAEDEQIDADEADYQSELELIAQQSDMPVRRVRARMEKNGQMDALRNQIVERKVIDRIVEDAKVKEVAADKSDDTESHPEYAVFFEVVPSREHDEIPEAKYDDNSPKQNDDNRDA